MKRPLGDASLGRRAPLTIGPSDDASLKNVSRAFGTDWPYVRLCLYITINQSPSTVGVIKITPFADIFCVILPD
jgi:hypothetical protein